HREGGDRAARSPPRVRRLGLAPQHRRSSGDRSARRGGAAGHPDQRPGLRRHRRRSDRRRRRPGDAACSRDARPHFARLNRRRPMTRNRPLATIAFIVLSLALTWLLALPLWLDGGLANPLAGTIISAMMFTP